jgi:hypothetical protein
MSDELIVYERNADGDYLDVPTESGRVFVYAQEQAEVDAMWKWFGDGELAAEYWKLAEQCRYEQWIESVRAFDDDELSDWEKAGAKRKYAALDVLYRFATLPHALESA